MNLDLIIYGIIGLVILYVLLKLLKWPLKLLINGICGVVLLYIINLIGVHFGIYIGINVITALVAGIFGIPGVIAIILFQMFL
ncbi:pro-sigmaK processing inhibitor BofA family protein [Clostridium sp. Ade.TY]|uniref:pro-sigmaK processing inhibitor BofA family protein n=1 Tax=Clostridium sp. Ade.TY TaxID=1391647 RepID=UPI00041ABFF1|nr:pro-sigmaK processing inhibitor BofA family protein [Clostridium sp. Ade.TY]